MLLTLHELLSRFQEYLDGMAEFSDVRRFVFQYYEAEQDFELDTYLEDVFPILLPYLQYEESEGDPQRSIRVRRLLNLLQGEQASIKERVVFALEFDDIRQLTEKFSSGKISENVYDQQIAKLLPSKYDCSLIEAWGKQHVNEDEPKRDKCTK